MLRGRKLGQAIGVVALICATFGVSTASAQVDYEIMASLQFNFSNPGARSLAMAGALTGAGDDATGAWTNPGGLTNITRPEVGVEFRGFNFKTVCAWWYRCENVSATLIGSLRATKVLLCICESNACACDGASLQVGDDSSNRRRPCLSDHNTRHCEHYQEPVHEEESPSAG